MWQGAAGRRVVDLSRKLIQQLDGLSEARSQRLIRAISLRTAIPFDPQQLRTNLVTFSVWGTLLAAPAMGTSWDLLTCRDPCRGMNALKSIRNGERPMSAGSIFAAPALEEAVA